ncbi:MAG: VOC family protein [Sphingomonadaceae bacterium]
MHVNRLDHVNIRTPALAETVAFYESVLGFRRGAVAAPVDQNRNAWLFDKAGKPLIHVSMPDENEPARNVGNTSRLDHIAFDCTGVDEIAGVLGNLGVPYDYRDLSTHGFVQFVVRDPNGISVELNFRTS